MHRYAPAMEDTAQSPIGKLGEAELLALTARELHPAMQSLVRTTEYLFAELPSDVAAENLNPLCEAMRLRLVNLLEDVENVILLTNMQTQKPYFAHNSSSLDEVLKAVKPELDAYASPYKVTLGPMPTGLGAVAGDWFYLKRALSCLLKTAVKYAHPGSEIRVCGQAFPQEAALVIQTSGHTLSPTELEQFFTVSSNVDGAAAGELDLAPALADRIITQLGGLVVVRNLAQGGICFHVVLPRDYVQAR